MNRISPRKKQDAFILKIKSRGGTHLTLSSALTGTLAVPRPQPAAPSFSTAVPKCEQTTPSATLLAASYAWAPLDIFSLPPHDHESHQIGLLGQQLVGVLL